MKHIGLFEGIGGFSLASETMGWETIAWCEINPFCHTVLNYHFPKATRHHDITKTDFTIYRGKCDIITGGFPCQPYSAAGKRLGTEDDRHLWPEMLRAIREIQPSWVVGENVRGLTNWNGGLVFDQVQADLENEGYEVTPFLLPACAVNAPHRRDRIWFIAHSFSARAGRKNREISDEERGAGEDRAESLRQTHGKVSASRIDSASPNGVTSDTNGNGHELRGLGEDRPAKAEGETDERKRERIWGDNWGVSQQGITANTDNSGAGIAMRNNGNGQTENQRWEGQSQPESGKIGSVAADTTNTGIEGMRPERENEIYGSRDANDTKDAGLSTRSVRPKKEQLGGRNITMGSRQWDGFPTQPPVCGRNDGLSARLVGITFSKHRQESIKAYGNAVVPQVVLQIFKAIEKYNNLSE